MTFLRNVWYVAGWASEVADAKLVSRTILGQAVVMFRTESGQLTALADRCPHRFVPLHIGQVKGEAIQCGYHGLEFGVDGHCVHNPHGDGKISSNMRVSSFPIEERDGVIWIWMGDPDKADPSAIVRFPMLTDSAWSAIFGYMQVDADYQLINDNLMDLSHAQFVHPIFQMQESPARVEYRAGGEDRRVWSKLEMYDTATHPFAALFVDHARIDSWLVTTWHAPSVIHLDIGTAEAGADWRAAAQTPSVHFLTPETDASTHYFWTAAWNVRLDDKALPEIVRQGIDAAFSGEDKPIIEMQQRELSGADLMSKGPVLLQTDATAIQVRRMIGDMLKVEAEASSSTAKETVS